MLKFKKEQALKLRLKNKSYNEIAKKLSVSKSTISCWLKNNKQSQNIKKVLTEKAKILTRKRMIAMGVIAKKKRNQLYSEMRLLAKSQYKLYKDDILFNRGLMIYWGEGDSKLQNGQIRVANTDPMMLKIFFRFIKTYLSKIAEKTRMYLVLYPDLKEEDCIAHWSQKINIAIDKFYKSQYIKGRSTFSKLPYGIATIIISNRAYKEVILEWLAIIKENTAKTR